MRAGPPIVYLWLGGSARWPWLKDAAYALLPCSRFRSPWDGIVSLVSWFKWSTARPTRLYQTFIYRYAIVSD